MTAARSGTFGATAMKVFISWSGDLSRQVAHLLREWISDVLQGVDVWCSTEDIERGSQWFGDIGKTLEETNVGIVCITRENKDAPWILFESGALSKGLSTSRVTPLLIDIAPTDLTPPLSMFNATAPTKNSMMDLIKMINKQRKETALPDNKVETSFEMWWSKFEIPFNNIRKSLVPKKPPTRRPIEDMVDEILETVRSLQMQMQHQSFSEPGLAVITATPRTGSEAPYKIYLSTPQKNSPEIHELLKNALSAISTSYKEPPPDSDERNVLLK
jgi:hypothetical protein